MQLLHVGTLAAFLGAAAIQPASALGQLSVPEVVRQMVVELYPGLDSGKNRIAFSTQPYSLRQPWLWHEVTASVSESDPSHPEMTVRILNVTVSFDSMEFLSELRASGPFVNTDQHHHLVEEVDRHSDWSDEQVLHTLRENGAHFTPDQGKLPERLLEQRVSALRPFVGSVTTSAIEFEIRKEDREPGDQAAQLYWRVTINVGASPGRPTQFEVLFEPFEGRLIEIAALRN